MIRFAKIVEYENHQFLVRACRHPAQAGVAGLTDPRFDSLLTIDTETPVPGGGLQPLRIVMNCQRPDWQARCFEAWSETACDEILEILLRDRDGLLTPEAKGAAVDRIQGLLLQGQL